jgi:hypothetical protein
MTYLLSVPRREPSNRRFIMIALKCSRIACCCRCFQNKQDKCQIGGGKSLPVNKNARSFRLGRLEAGFSNRYGRT